MARIFITDSSDGPGLMAAQLMASEGHQVVLHARNLRRADDARASLPSAEAVVLGNLATVAAMRDVARQVNSLGRFDAVIHNTGLGYREPSRTETEDGLSQLFAVNVLAPYVLTALIERPRRLVYLSGNASRRENGSRKPELVFAPMEWIGRLCRDQTPGCAFGIRHRPPLDERPFQRP